MTVNAVSLLAVVVLGASVLILASATRRQDEAWQWVVHTREVLGRLEQVLSGAHAAETAQRGYLLTRDDDFLREFEAAANALPGHVEEVAELTRDNPTQQLAIVQLRQLAQQRIRYLRDVAARAVFSGTETQGLREGRAIMHALTARVGGMIGEENRLLARRESDAERARQLVLGTVAAVGLTALLLIAVLRWSSRRDLRVIAQAAAQLQAVFRAAPVGLGILDRNLHLSDANDALVRACGRPADGLIDHGLLNAMSDRRGERLGAIARQVLDERRPVTGVEMVQAEGHRDGDWLASVHPVADAGDQVAAIVALLEITPLKRAQRELADANRLLESRVIERTEDLQAFAHTVAHDLRAPLRNIEGFSSALLEDEADRLSEDGLLYVRRIQVGVRRMDALITDLLAYSRLARDELVSETVDLDAAVDRALHELASVVQARSATVDAQRPLGAVTGNATLVVQVLVNLVANAITFVRDGVLPRVRIEARREGPVVRLGVEDNGIGIRPEHRDRIFGVFERLHGQEAYPGTGIGLAIVRRAVLKMRGQVRVTDGALGGSRFEVDLPAASASQ
jgi:PAS domain S-box-containing protein